MHEQDAGSRIGSDRPEFTNEYRYVDVLRPGFLGQWAFLVFVLFFGSLLLMAWTIHYPEIIRCNARVVETYAENRAVKLKVEVCADRLYEVASGQTVKLVFENYSIGEFGFVSGTLENTTYSGDAVVAQIHLPQKFETNLNKMVQSAPGLRVDVVFFQDRRLLKRLFSGSSFADLF